MGRLKRKTWGIALAVTLACGSKSALLDETSFGGASGETGRGGAGAAGGAAGSAGRGGSAGAGGAAGTGGAAGVAGAGGAGGAVGGGGAAGMAGAAGSAGTPGGTGGVASGGAGGASGSADQVIDALCRHYQADGCADETCPSLSRRDFDANEVLGCGDEYLESRICVLSSPTPCDLNLVCPEGIAILQKCIDDYEFCIRGNHPTGGCVMGCEAWGTDCRPSPAGLACSCTTGSRPGFRFDTTDPCQSEEWLKTIRATCQ